MTEQQFDKTQQEQDELHLQHPSLSDETNETDEVMEDAVEEIADAAQESVEEMGEPVDTTKKEKWNKIFNVILTVLLIMMIIFFGARAYVSQYYGGVNVSGHSMQQTLQDGEWLLMHLADKGAKANYGDIIVLDVRGYKNATAEEGFLIKRLIAKGGDQLYCEQGQIFICYAGTDEFVLLEEPYAYYEQDKSTYSFASKKNPYKIQEGEIFYLGDNRQNSKDSEEEFASSRGMILKETDIHGVVPKWAVKFHTALRWIFLTETFFKTGE